MPDPSLEVADVGDRLAPHDQRLDHGSDRLVHLHVRGGGPPAADLQDVRVEEPPRTRLVQRDLGGGEADRPIDDQGYDAVLRRCGEQAHRNDAPAPEPGAHPADVWGGGPGLAVRLALGGVQEEPIPSLRVCYDEAGAFALNNVRVNGIPPAAETDPWFLLGILNAPVADFVFRRTAKPKDGGWFEANRQFVKDLPIPHADAANQVPIAALAASLQLLHRDRRRILNALARRLDIPTRALARMAVTLPPEMAPF